MALVEFVTRHSFIQFGIVEKFLDRLMVLKKFFATQKLYKFYSSSILFVYDAATPKDPKVNVKLVDFAHTLPNDAKDNTLDTNFQKSLHNLIAILEGILRLGGEIYENQRLTGDKWSKESVTERPSYSSADGKWSLGLENPNDWSVDKKKGDNDGWLYAASFRGPWNDKGKGNVRRRRWVKKVVNK